MTTTASEIFTFLSGPTAFAAERHEISSAAFGDVRRSLRAIIMQLREGGDPEAIEISDRLRSHLSEWLTVPLPFNGTILSTLRTFGSPIEVGARWGRDIQSDFETALRAAEALQLVENPIRVTLRGVIRDLKTAGRDFKIYCHKTARPHFDSLAVAPANFSLGSGDFLHSVREYRDSNIFDTLIKVGPLRSWGWGSAPDAIKSAPRFGTMVQIVWAGCADEPGFGYDPASSLAEALVAGDPAGSSEEALVSRVAWTLRVTRSGDLGVAPTDSSAEQDDFQIFGRLNPTGVKRRALLVQIDSHHGILYPLHTHVLSFDPAVDARAAVWRRRPGEELHRGMFVARRLLRGVDLGGLHVEHDHYSQIWKFCLNEERHRNLDGLVNRLRAAGLDLTCLPAVIRNWCVASTTVIHAPHKSKHFELLIQVLGVGTDVKDESHASLVQWSRRAWDEIRRSRGEAIQAGLHGQEILDDQLLITLSNLLPSIRELAAREDGFSLVIPADHPVQGTVLFNKVAQIEEGFLAPDTELKVVRDLSTIEQWRA